MAQAAADPDRLSILESRLEALEERLLALEARGPRTVPSGVHVAEEEALPAGSDVTRLFGLTGRTLIVFGGAYLLRALTAAGYLPNSAGVLLAFLYALTWLWLADRAGAGSNGASAGFHGATAVLIGLPLLWEATARFHYLAPQAAGLAVAGFLLATLAVACRRNLHGLVWVAGVVATITALALLATTHVAAPFAFDLIVLGIAGVGLYYGRDWHAAGWWLALLGPLGGILATFGGLAQHRDQLAALGSDLLLLLGTLAIVVFLSLVRGREIGAYDSAQSLLAAAVGYGGAMLLARDLGSGAAAMVGSLGLLLAVGAYEAAFRLIPRSLRRKLLLYSLLGLGFTLAASGLLLARGPRAVTWSVLAVLAGGLAVRLARVTLSLHGAVYSVAAAAASGLLTTSLYAFVTPATVAWPRPAPQALLALLAAAALCALPVPHPAPFWKPYEGLTRTLRIAVFLWGLAGAALYLLAPTLAGVPGGDCDAGLLAALRTAVLTFVALLLGWASRWPAFREAGWLVYPTLALAVLKLVVEDFPHGRPTTLFVALALCGLAFLFAPRLARGPLTRPAV